MEGRVISCPHGKGLGSSSSINGIVYIHRYLCDFNNWVKLSANSWGYHNVLPYFKKAENWQGGTDPPYRGTSGPLHGR